MKYTINATPFIDLYYVKINLQHYLNTDEGITILIRFNKHSEWNIAEKVTTRWAQEAGHTVTVEKHLVYRVRRL